MIDFVISPFGGKATALGATFEPYKRLAKGPGSLTNTLQMAHKSYEAFWIWAQAEAVTGWESASATSELRLLSLDESRAARSFADGAEL